jgi:ketosteroid isomerase-like protein
MSATADVIREWVRAINSRDPEAPIALVTPDFELVESSTLPGAARVSGPEGLRRYGAGWARNWSDWELSEVEIIEVAPDQAVLVADLRLRGLRSGIDVERRWAYLMQIRNGKLARQVDFDDTEEALRAARS